MNFLGPLNKRKNKVNRINLSRLSQEFSFFKTFLKDDFWYILISYASKNPFLDY